MGVQLTHLCGLHSPRAGLVLVFLENRLGAYHVPRAQRHHRLGHAERSSAVVEVHAQRGIARAAVKTILVRLTHEEVCLDVAQLSSLSNELRSIFFVFEHVIPVAVQVQQTNLERRRVVLEVCGFSRTF